MKIYMRSILVALTILLISSNALAQKIKIKKDILYIDKQETPIAIQLEHKVMDNMGDFHQVYTFSDMSSDTVFLYADYKGHLIPGINGKLTWLEISDANRNKTNSVDFEGGLFSSKKHVVLALLNKYEFFNREGVVNHEKIDAFMASTTRSNVKEQAYKALGKTDNLRKLDPHISADLTILKGGPTGDSIGRVALPQNQNANSTLTYRVYDLDENLIASAAIQSNANLVRVVVRESPTSEIRFDYRTRFGLAMEVGGEKFLEELVEQLFLKGYHLEHQYNEVNKVLDSD